MSSQDLIPEALVPSQYLHRTFLKIGEAVEIRKCDDISCSCKRDYHCPFCDVHHYKPTKPGRVQEHLEESHWPFSVHYKDLLIVCCFRDCGEESAGHFHCPVCGECLHKRQRFVPHLRLHLEQQGEDLGLAYAPVAKQPAVIIYNGMTVRLCTKVCGDSPLDHYHCPACDFLGLTNSRICTHLRKCERLLKGRSKLPLKEYTIITPATPVPDPRDVFIDFWHPSTVRTVSDLNVRRCQLRNCCNKRYHCPLCSKDVFKPTYINLLRKHFRVHWDKRVTLKDYTFLSCNLECELPDGEAKVMHYHCPLCGVIKNGKNSFQLHLKSCGDQLGDIMHPVNDSVDTVTDSVDRTEALLDDGNEAEEYDDDNDENVDQSINVSFSQMKEIEVFDSVSAVISRPLLEAFNFKSLEAVQTFLSDVGGTVCVSVEPSPGTDPSQPIYSFRGSLDGILKTELILQQRFNDMNEDLRMKVKISDRGVAPPSGIQSSPTQSADRHQKDGIQSSADDSDRDKGVQSTKQLMDMSQEVKTIFTDADCEESGVAAPEHPPPEVDGSADHQYAKHNIGTSSPVKKMPSRQLRRGKVVDQNPAQETGEPKHSDKSTSEKQKRSRELNESSPPRKKSKNRDVSLQADIDSDNGETESVPILPHPNTETEDTSRPSPVGQKRYSTRGHRVDVSMLSSPRRRGSGKPEDTPKATVAEKDRHNESSKSKQKPKAIVAMKSAKSDQTSYISASPRRSQRYSKDVSNPPADVKVSKIDQTLSPSPRRSQRNFIDVTKAQGNVVEGTKSDPTSPVSKGGLREPEENIADVGVTTTTTTTTATLIPAGTTITTRTGRSGRERKVLTSLLTGNQALGTWKEKQENIITITCEEGPLNAPDSQNERPTGNTPLEISVAISKLPGSITLSQLADMMPSMESGEKSRPGKSVENIDDAGLEMGGGALDHPPNSNIDSDQQKYGTKQLFKDSIKLKDTDMATEESSDEDRNGDGSVSDPESEIAVNASGEGFKQLKSVKNEGPIQLSFYLKEKPSFIPIVRAYRSYGKLKVDRRSQVKKDADIANDSEVVREMLEIPENSLLKESDNDINAPEAEGSPGSLHSTSGALEIVPLADDPGSSAHQKATPKKMHTCTLCGRKFRYASELLKHTETNHGNFKCDHCDEIFEKKTALNWHLTAVHKVEVKVTSKAERNPPVSCKRCDKLFLNAQLLRLHMVNSHKGPLPCTMCGKEFKKQVRLRRHITTVHMKTTVVCDICGKSFSNKRYLRVHLKRHTGIKNHQCRHCSKQFFEANTLKEHEQTHKPRSEREYRYICSYCGAGYVSKSNFADHINKHTGDRPYHCDICNKNFSYKTQIKSHMVQTHSDVKPFACSYCSKCFKTKTKLQAHTVTHTGVSKHVCSSCKKAFGSATILRKHQPRCKCSNPNLDSYTEDDSPLSIVAASGVKTERPYHSTSVMDLASLALAEEIHIQPTDQQIIPVEEFDGNTSANLSNDLELIQEDTYLFMCSVCNRAFDDMESAQTHISEAHGENAIQLAS